MFRRVRAYLSQGGGGGTPPAGDPPAGDPLAGDPPAGDPPAGNENDAAWLKAELTKVRREAAGHRTKANQLETELNTRKQAEMSDLEKAQASVKALEAEREAARDEARQARAEVAIARAAAKAGLPADLAARLVKPEFDDKGQPTGIDEQIADLVKQYPQLVTGEGAPPPTGGGSSNAARTRAGGLTLEAVKAMTPQEFAALSPEQKQQVNTLLSQQK